MKKFELAREVYLKELEIMKETLDLLGFKMDKRTKDFVYVKSQIMNFTYENLKKLFKHMADEKLIKKCPCGTNIRRGYKRCICGGSGWINYKS